jgi:hypothetical protein
VSIPRNYALDLLVQLFHRSGIKKSVSSLGGIEYRRRNEWAFVCAHDRVEIAVSELWYLVSQEWWEKWSNYSSKKGQNEPPGPISNSKLFTSDGKNLRPGLQLGRDYRAACKEVWELLQGTYGGGPVVARPTTSVENLPLRRSMERAAIAALDRTNIHPGEHWMMLALDWLTAWLNFTTTQNLPPPGPVRHRHYVLHRLNIISNVYLCILC